MCLLIVEFRSARGELFLFVSNPNSKVLSVCSVGAAANLGDSFSGDDLSNRLMLILGKIFGADCPGAVSGFKELEGGGVSKGIKRGLDAFKVSSFQEVYKRVSTSPLHPSIHSPKGVQKWYTVSNRVSSLSTPPLHSLSKFQPKDVYVTSWHTNEFTNGCFPYIPVGRSEIDYDTLAEPVESTSNITRPYLFFAGDHTSREYPGRLHGAFLSGLREAARIANTFLGALNEGSKQAKYETLGQSFVKNMKAPTEEIYLSD